MIYGIGSDIVEVARVQNKWNRRGVAFAQRILTPKEFKMFKTLPRRAHFLATRFAVKEAFFKALGTGMRGGLSFQHVTVVKDHVGKPDLVCTGFAKELLKQHKIANMHITISDEREYAIAFVILEKI